jgi:hypothetical protein
MSAVAVPEIKEVQMDVGVSTTQEGGNSGGTRRRRGRRRTQKGGAADEAAAPAIEASVEKVGATSSINAPAVAAPAAPAAATQVGGGAKTKAPVVVIAPPKKKPAKLLLVPKMTTAAAAHKGRVIPKKTFKARRVRVVIDNTAKTVKRRKQILGQINDMTEDQLRAAAVQARLSRRESVATVPTDLLRQMVRDYQTMRGALL